MLKKIEFSKIVKAPIEVAYTIVAGVNKYPEFVPNVYKVKILYKDGNHIGVEMEVRKWIIKKKVQTLVQYTKYDTISFEQIKGPFKTMRGQWQFDQVEDGTKVVFQSEVEMDGHISAELIMKIFRRDCKRIMKAFIRRAEIISARI